MKFTAILTAFAVASQLTTAAFAEPRPGSDNTRLVARQIYHRGAAALESSLYRRALELESTGELSVRKLFARTQLKDHDSEIQKLERRILPIVPAVIAACARGYKKIKDKCVKI